MQFIYTPNRSNEKYFKSMELVIVLDFSEQFARWMGLIYSHRDEFVHVN